MGAGVSSDDDTLRQEEYEELESISGFNRGEIKKLYKRFKTLDRAGKGTLNEDDLKRIPEVMLNPMVDKIMETFGFSKIKTTINLKDFIQALSQFNVRKSNEEILFEVFTMFDANGDGKIDKEELTSMIRVMVGPPPTSSSSSSGTPETAENSSTSTKRENMGLPPPPALNSSSSSSANPATAVNPPPAVVAMPDRDVSDLVDYIIIEADDDGDGALNFDEFKRALDGTEVEAKLDQKRKALGSVSVAELLQRNREREGLR